MSVDSAPWFSFTPPAVSPSWQPPVAGMATGTPVSLSPRNQPYAISATCRYDSGAVARYAASAASNSAVASIGCWSNRAGASPLGHQPWLPTRERPPDSVVWAEASQSSTRQPDAGAWPRPRAGTPATISGPRQKCVLVGHDGSGHGHVGRGEAGEGAERAAPAELASNDPCAATVHPPDRRVADVGRVCQPIKAARPSAPRSAASERRAAGQGTGRRSLAAAAAATTGIRRPVAPDSRSPAQRRQRAGVGILGPDLVEPLAFRGAEVAEAAAVGR